MTRKLCAFYVEKKGRFCNLTPQPDSKFCAEHNTDDPTRVPCPLDPSHTVNRNQVETHLAKCNRTKKALEYQEFKTVNINDADPVIERPYSAVSLKEIPEDEVQAVKKKVLEIAGKLYAHFEVSPNEPCSFVKEVMADSRHWILNCGIPESQMTPEQKERRDRGFNIPLDGRFGNGRHVYQNGCLVEMLKLNKIFEPDYDYVEFGAGRGGLSYWIAATHMFESGGKPPTGSYTLIDFCTVRHKFEARKTLDGVNFKRINSDLADIDLCKLTYLKESKGIVFVAKHICGDAVDFAIRSLLTAPEHYNLKGLLIATCCHHRCTWEQSCLRSTDIRLNSKDFFIASRLSTWATCGGDLDEESVKIGRYCKHLIDQGRLNLLEKKFNPRSSFLVPFTSVKYTPENVVILAVF